VRAVTVANVDGLFLASQIAFVVIMANRRPPVVYKGACANVAELDRSAPALPILVTLALDAKHQALIVRGLKSEP
jgi:hypothetical protein